MGLFDPAKYVAKLQKKVDESIKRNGRNPMRDSSYYTVNRDSGFWTEPHHWREGIKWVTQKVLISK